MEEPLLAQLTATLTGCSWNPDVVDAVCTLWATEPERYVIAAAEVGRMILAASAQPNAGVFCKLLLAGVQECDRANMFQGLASPVAHALSEAVLKFGWPALKATVATALEFVDIDVCVPWCAAVGPHAPGDACALLSEALQRELDFDVTDARWNGRLDDELSAGVLTVLRAVAWPTPALKRGMVALLAKHSSMGEGPAVKLLSFVQEQPQSPFASAVYEAVCKQLKAVTNAQDVAHRRDVHVSESVPSLRVIALLVACAKALGTTSAQQPLQALFLQADMAFVIAVASKLLEGKLVALCTLAVDVLLQQRVTPSVLIGLDTNLQLLPLVALCGRVSESQVNVPTTAASASSLRPGKAAHVAGTATVADVVDGVVDLCDSSFEEDCGAITAAAAAAAASPDPMLSSSTQAVHTAADRLFAAVLACKSVDVARKVLDVAKQSDYCRHAPQARKRIIVALVNALKEWCPIIPPPGPVSWAQASAVFSPEHAALQAFFRGPTQKYRIKGFLGVKEARAAAEAYTRRNGKMSGVLPHGYFATFEVKGAGKQSEVVVEKTCAGHEEMQRRHDASVRNHKEWDAILSAVAAEGETAATSLPA